MACLQQFQGDASQNSISSSATKHAAQIAPGGANAVAQPLIAPPHQRDERLKADGSDRELWRYLLDGLTALGPLGISERQEKARRILRDDGATYTDYNQTQGAKAWELDLVPLLVGSDEWAGIESGLLERAELFNLILLDLYGPRDLIRTGVIPPEAIFAHGGFLRPCSGIRLHGDHELILHSADMARAPDGSMCVFADRTQSPSGAGYALENRTVMSRVLPSLFRDSHVHRLSRFFQRLRAKLSQLAPNADEPRVVVLTPGALNETHFEHAYLANYLGYPLVQSGDLLVRNGFVWMKSLEGLVRVDVILRRVDDWYCDPLELKGDSQLGVPGLLDSARQGRVAIANPLGSGVLENPLLLKYLPQIGKRLLGREPRLNSVATFWCGDEKDRKYVFEHFAQLVVRPIYRGLGVTTAVDTLTQEQQQALRSTILQSPHLYVAQERLEVSQAPTLVAGQLQSRPAILRSFTVASESSYAVMPGGLTRASVLPGASLISNQLGSVNKDTWVVATEPERPSAPERDLDKQVSQIQYTGLPSRVVENLFWLGRYAERAEASLRVLRSVFIFLNGVETLPVRCRDILLRAVTSVTDTHPGFLSGNKVLLENAEPELMAVILDGSRMGSVKSCLNAMLNCAEESKELLSSDTLRVINDVRDVLSGLDVDLRSGLMAAPEEALDPLVTALMALSGLTQESMIRGVGWRFMEIGRRLERGAQVVMFLRSVLVQVLDEADQSIILQATLLVLEVLITYRRRYRARMDMAHSLELVLLDTSNPRSLIYQFEQLQTHIDNLPAVGISSRELQAEQRALLEATSKLRLSRLVELARASSAGDKREELDKLLQELTQMLNTIGRVVSDKYFDHRAGPQQLVRAVWEG